MPDYAVAMGFSARDLGVMEQYDKMARGAEDFGDRASRAFDKVNNHSSQALRNATKHGYNFGAIVKGIIAADLIRGGVNQVKDGLGSIFHEFVEFDHAMTQAMVRFEDVGPRATNFKNIVKDTGHEIRQLALTSRFSFTDLAKAYAQVGRSKMFGHEEGVQALVPLMNLNIDAQGDFEESTRNIMDSMGAWAMNTLPVKDRLKGLYDMTDLFAQAQNEAQVSVSDLAETMKTVGPISRGMGYTIKDVTALVVLLGKAGIKGTEAATALKNISAHLVNPTDQMKFANMQVPIVDKITQAPRKLSAIFADINTQFKKLTPNQRLGVMFEGFGLRGIAGAMDISRQIADLGDIEKRLKDIEGIGAENAARMNADTSTMLDRVKKGLQEKGMQILDKYGDRFLGWLDRMSVAINNFDIDPIVRALDSMGNVLGIVYSVMKPFLPVLPYIVLGFYGWKASMAGWKWIEFTSGVLSVTSGVGGLVGKVGLLTGAWRLLTAAMSANPLGLLLIAGAAVYSASNSLHTGKDNFFSESAQSLGLVPKLAHDANGVVLGRADGNRPDLHRYSSQESNWSPSDMPLNTGGKSAYPAPNSTLGGRTAGHYMLTIAGAPTGTTFSGSAIGGAPELNANMLGAN